MKILKVLVYLLILNSLILIGYLVSNPIGRVVYELETANLTRVVDGDTIETDLGKVRLLGINTPERKEAGEGYGNARNFLLVFEGREIELLRLDEDEDKYKRKLRYVYFGDILLNKEIVERGLGHKYYYGEDEFRKEIEESEEEARKKEIGIWEKSKDECSSCIVLSELNNNDPGEYIILGNICSFSCSLKDWSIKDEATHIRVLDFSIEGRDAKKINYEGRVWNDAGDSLFLRDEKGLLVLFYRY